MDNYRKNNLFKNLSYTNFGFLKKIPQGEACVQRDMWEKTKCDGGRSVMSGMSSTDIGQLLPMTTLV